MGKITSEISFTGSVGNITVDKYKVVRRKPAPYPVTAIRTIEGNSEFRTAGQSTQLLFNALRYSTRHIRDKRAYVRLMSAMLTIIQADEVNVRGKRVITDPGLILLKKFDFNTHASLSAIVWTKINTITERTKGEIQVHIGLYSPARFIDAPNGATHFRFLATAVEVDFQKDEAERQMTESAEISLDSTAESFTTLNVAFTPQSTKPVVIGLGIKFYQLVNGGLQPLHNSEANAFQIIEVDIAS